MTVITWPLATGLEAAYDDSELQKLNGSSMQSPGGAAIYSGVRPSGSLDGLLATANGTPNNTVSIAAGVLYHNTTATPEKSYVTINDAAKVLTVPAADATLLRKDAVFADPSAALATDRIIYVAGTPGGASYPTLTGTRYRLANVDCRSILVAGGTIIRPADIFDQRGYAAAMGGRLICTSTTRPATPYKGMEIYETNTGLVYTYNGTAWASTALTEVVTSTTRPGSPSNGKEIFETDTGIKRLWRSDQSKWQAVGGDLPSCKFQRNSTVSVPNNSWNPVTWEQVIWDDPGGATNFSGTGTAMTFTVNGQPTRIAIPLPGIYQVSYCVKWDTGGTGTRESQIRMNSAGAIGSGTFLFSANEAPNPGGSTYADASQLINVTTAGNYIELHVYHNNGANLNRLGGADFFITVNFVRDIP